jgi:hypothetical protein
MSRVENKKGPLHQWPFLFKLNYRLTYCITTQPAKLASAKDQFTKLFRKVSTNFGRILR